MDDVIIVAIVFGFSAFVCTGIYKLIMAKMQRTHGLDSETFERMAEAFIQHRKEMNRRVQNIETIIARDEDPPPGISGESKSHNEGTLNNNLNSKKRVQ